MWLLLYATDADYNIQVTKFASVISAVNEMKKEYSNAFNEQSKHRINKILSNYISDNCAHVSTKNLLSGETTDQWWVIKEDL